MDKELMQDNIAKRAAQELKDGQVVNLGIGLPVKVISFLPKDIDVMFFSENGFFGLGPHQEPVTDPTAISPAGKPATIVPGGCFVDSSLSFGIIRGGHLDISILGALQVDSTGSIANYLIPGKLVPGMGGAMDLLTGAKKIIVTMEHKDKDGNPKILKKCTLPLTAQNEVNMIITEMAVIEVTPEGLVLKEVGEGFTVEDVIKATEAELIISDALKQL